MKRLLVLVLLVSSVALNAETVVEGPVMVVTPYRSAGLDRDTPAAVSVYGVHDLDLAGRYSIVPVLEASPGVDLQGGGVPGSAVKLNLRGLAPGFQTKRVLVLVDGRRLNEQYQGNAELMTLDMSPIERAELVRGPASAAYGSAAQAGVLQLFTRQGKGDPRTRLRLLGGDHGTLQIVAERGESLGRFDYYFTAGYVQTDGYLKNSQGEDQDWAAQQYSLNSGIMLGDSAELRFLTGYYDGEGADDNSDRELTKDYQQLVYQYAPLSERYALMIQGYRLGEENLYGWYNRPAGVYDQETLAAEIQFEWTAGDMHKLTTGFEVRREGVDIKEVQGNVDEATVVTSGYIQDWIQLGEVWSLIAGVRYDYHEDFDSAWSPRVGLLRRLSDWGEVYATYNQAHRAPALSDRFVNVEFNGLQFIGNPDLNPETLRAWELGGRTRLSQLEGGVALFYNDLEDSFDFVFQPSDGTFRNENATETETYGAEIWAEYEVGEHVAIKLGYTYVDGEYVEYPAQAGVSGNRPAYLAQHLGYFGVTVMDWLLGRHQAVVQYTGERYGDAQNSPERRLDDYIKVDWHSRLAIGENLALNLNIRNLFDEQYQTFPEYDEPGRTVLAGIETAW